MVPDVAVENGVGEYVRRRRNPTADLGVERPACRFAGLGLLQKTLSELVAQAAFVPESSAALAFSATSANAFGSLTARSASDLRSSSMPAA
jgi:hypothetical protein